MTETNEVVTPEEHSRIQDMVQRTIHGWSEEFPNASKAEFLEARNTAVRSAIEIVIGDRNK